MRDGPTCLATTRKMSRSHRHTPIVGWTLARSEKRDKRLANRKLRAAIREALHHENEVMPVLREVSNVWDFNKDGRQWWPLSLLWKNRNR